MIRHIQEAERQLGRTLMSRSFYYARKYKSHIQGKLNMKARQNTINKTLCKYFFYFHSILDFPCVSILNLWDVESLRVALALNEDQNTRFWFQLSNSLWPPNALPHSPHLCEWVLKVLVLVSHQSIVREINEIMFIRGFSIFIVVKHQRLQIHPAIVVAIIIVSNRKSKERSSFLLFL